MTIGEDDDEPAPAGTEPWDGEDWTDAADATLAASEDARFFEPTRRGRWARPRFLAILALVLLVHASVITAFLLRDAKTDMRVAAIEETPIEVIVEKPPEPPKPPPQPKQEEPPPKPKEDLSPAMSAPRAPTDVKVETPKKEAKTAAPTKQATPTQGQPQSAPAAAPPKEATPSDTKQDEAAKEDDTKPDAEALDKARRKAAKAKQSKEAKAAPKRRAPPNALAALAGAPSLDATMSFARPTPKAKVYGGTEDMRWMSEVEAMLEARVQKLPRTAHYQTGGKVAICFHVDVSGRVINKDYCAKSGYPDIDNLAMHALLTAAPFPPPPPGLERGLIWISTFDGQVPVLHFR